MSPVTGATIFIRVTEMFTQGSLLSHPDRIPLTRTACLRRVEELSTATLCLSQGAALAASSARVWPWPHKGRNISYEICGLCFCVGSYLKANYVLAHFKSFAGILGTPRRGLSDEAAFLGKGQKGRKDF